MAGTWLASSILGVLFIWIYKGPGCQGTSCHTNVSLYGPRLCERLCSSCSRCNVSKYHQGELTCFLKTKTKTPSRQGASTRMINSRVHGMKVVSEGARAARDHAGPSRKGVFVCTLSAKISHIDESATQVEHIEHKDIEACYAIAYEGDVLYVIDKGGVIKSANLTQETLIFKQTVVIKGNRMYTYLSVDSSYGYFYIGEVRDSKKYLFKRKHQLRERKLAQRRVTKVQVHKQTKSVFYVDTFEKMTQVFYNGSTIRSFDKLRFTGCFQLYVNGTNIFYYGYDNTNVVHHVIFPLGLKTIVNELGQQSAECTVFWRVGDVMGILFYNQPSAFIISKTKKPRRMPFPNGRSLAVNDD